MKKWICIILAVILLLGVLPMKGISASNADELDISDAFLEIIKQYEGFTNGGKPYWDYSQYSIGYGSFCSYEKDDTYYYYMENPLTEAQASEKLVAELQSHIGHVRKFLKKYDMTATQNEFDALVSLTYNIGQKWTTSTGYYIHRALTAEERDINFIIYSLGLYSTAGGEYLAGLITRRLSEANMFANGVYQRALTDNMKYVFMDGAGGKVAYKVHGYDANRGSKIYTEIKEAPVGPDKNGNIVTYELEGWYTAREGGTKVEVLDESLPNGSVLYAHWKTPDGDSVVIPEANVSLPVTVSGGTINMRYGPGTFYGRCGSAKTGDVLTVTQTATGSGYTWGKTEKGWIALTYTDYDAAVSAYLPHWALVTADSVNVRKSVGTDADIVGTKNAGDPVQILEWTHSDDTMWGRTEEGWLSLQYVQWVEADPNAEYTVVFKNYDGTVLSSNVYKYGAAVTVPTTPTKPADSSGVYLFKGWDKTVTVCIGNAEYTAVYELLGDVDKNGKVNEDDGIYLLWHIFFPSDYPIDSHVDFDGNGKVNEDDAIYLLWYVFYPQDYPLKAS